MGDRRPLATRERAFAKRAASALARAGISPNAISSLSMAFGAASGAAFWATAHLDGGWVRVAWVAAALFIQLRLLANMLDGMVAQETGKSSPLGELFNEAPDRFSDVATIVGAGYALGGHVVLGYWVAILALLVAYVRALGASAGAGQAFSGPAAKPHRMFILTVAALYGAVMPASKAMTIALAVIAAGCIVTLVRRLRWIAGKL